MKKQKFERIRDYGVVLSYILFIYFSLPFIPGLWKRLVVRTGVFANYFAAVILAAFGFFIVFYLVFKRKGASSLIWLLILSFVYVICLTKLELPIERMHFVEYGLLSIFVFRALSHKIRDKSLYLWSGLAVFCLGFLDEGIQYILPNRVYELKDVLVNAVAGILGLFLIGLCFRPKLESLRCSR